MKIYLGGHLNFYHRGEGNCLNAAVDHPTRLLDIITQFGIPPNEVHLVVINDVLADIEAIVSDSDRVKLYSAVGGG